MNPAEIRAMTKRISARRGEVAEAQVVPVRGPAWSERVVDTGSELLAIHGITAEPYPLDLRKDLDPEDAAVVIVRRILRAGGSPAEAERFLGAFCLDPNTVRRMVRELGESA